MQCRGKDTNGILPIFIPFSVIVMYKAHYAAHSRRICSSARDRTLCQKPVPKKHNAERIKLAKSIWIPSWSRCSLLLLLKNALGVVKLTLADIYKGSVGNCLVHVMRTASHLSSRAAPRAPICERPLAGSNARLPGVHFRSILVFELLFVVRGKKCPAVNMLHRFWKLVKTKVRSGWHQKCSWLSFDENMGQQGFVKKGRPRLLATWRRSVRATLLTMYFADLLFFFLVQRLRL